MASTFDPERLFLFDQKKFGPPSIFVCWDHPPHETADKAHYSETEQCLVVERDGDARAYPLYLIASHHLATDVLGGKETLITF